MGENLYGDFYILNFDTRVLFTQKMITIPSKLKQVTLIQWWYLYTLYLLYSLDLPLLVSTTGAQFSVIKVPQLWSKSEVFLLGRIFTVLVFLMVVVKNILSSIKILHQELLHITSSWTPLFLLY